MKLSLKDLGELEIQIRIVAVNVTSLYRHQDELCTIDVGIMNVSESRVAIPFVQGAHSWS